MKKLYILSILLLSITFAHAQRINYDISSKWFLGLNAGVTWNSNDVKNVNSSGYGLILGRSFNYNYGKKISFDLRGRYLTGTWVGQDTSVTPLLNYQGGPLDSYNVDSNSIYVNNFQTNVRRLALELVLHLNSFHEKTGFDPYVFGGIGLTWTQTYGDLLYTIDSSSLYDYASLQQAGPIGPQLPSTLDGLYETRLDGGTDNQYKVRWMPSLGFGLGYQLGKRTSLGIEHKTTFTRGDTFDGFISESPRLKNDWHHYTSAYLRINFKSRGGNTSENSSSNVNNYTSTSNCPKPVVTLVSGNNRTVTNSQYRIEFKVSNLLNASGATFLNDQNQPVLFNYNTSTNVLDAMVSLHDGQNRFYLTASNNCGSETATVLVTLLNCVTPTATFTSPNGGNITVKTNEFAFSAIVHGSVNANGIKLVMNGMSLNGATYNQANGLIQRVITLVPGVNTIQLTVANDCGTNSYTATINYDNCVPVSLQLLHPSASGTTTNSANYMLSAALTGSLTNVQVRVFQNGLQIPNVVVQANGQIQIPTILTAGFNTFNLEVSNGCGNDAELTTINYQNCSAPLISIQSPLQNQSLTATANAVSLKSTISNVATKQNIKVIVNGIEQSNFTFNATTGALELGLNPVSGNNSITITATNNCGSDVETIQFNYINCTGITPNVSILSAGGTTNSAIYALLASTVNLGGVAPTVQTITVKQNGSPISFNQASGQISAITTLIPGINTFVVTASTASCGTDSKTITVNYNNCIAPQITLIQPTTTGGTTNNGTLQFKASATNIVQSQNIQLVKNGQQIPFTFANGIIDANITLTNGINTITLSVNNTCGNDAETFTLNYVQCIPPTIQFYSAIPSGTTVTNANFEFSAIVLGATAQNMSLKLNGVSTAFNNGNDAVTSALVLSPGLNTIVFNASNDCGVDVETITVNYDNCIAPSISNFSTNPSTVIASTSQTITANIAHATTQNIIFTQNGIQCPFSFVNGQFSAPISLVSGVNSLVLSVNNNCGTEQHTWNINYTPCTAPIVTIVNPTNSGLSVNASSYTFQANLQNVTTMQGVLFSLNGVSLNNFALTNGVLTANLNLQNGLNTIVLKGTNACGTDIKTVTIFYSNCIAPIITITTPLMNTGNVTTAAFTYTANIQNIPTNQGIILSLNSVAITNYTFVNGQITANVVLNPGVNTFYLNVSNACGTDSKKNSVTYLNCQTPVVTIGSPATNNVTVTNASYTFQATTQHMSSLQGINLLHNGTQISNLIFANGQLSAGITLSPGLNTFALSATNTCGTDSETRSIQYTACNAPIVTITNPSSISSTVSNASFAFSATIQNASLQELSLTVNGVSVGNLNLLNGQVSATIALSNGNNEVVLTATNACGTATKTVYLKFENCLAPIVSISNSTSTNSTVSTPSYSFNGEIQNIGSGQGISLTLNGNVIPNASFINGQISAFLNLNNGQNVIVLTATNSCGTDAKTVTVNYEQCLVPIVSILNPADLYYSMYSPILPFQASIQNISNSQGISLTVAGNPVTNFNFDNGNLSTTLNLPEGIINIVLTATNGCGTSTQSRTIRYQSCIVPVINVTTVPLSGSTVTLNNLVYTATLMNYMPNCLVQLLVNGIEQTTFDNSNGNISAAINLVPGNNDIQLTAISPCGSDTKLYTVIFDGGSQNIGNGNTDGMMQQNQQPGQNKTNEPQPAPIQTKPVTTPKPVQTSPPPAKPAPVQNQPAQPKPVTTPSKPVQTPPPPAKPAPVQNQPTQPKPVTTPSKPVQTPPPPAKPTPVQNQPAQTKPATTPKPVQTPPPPAKPTPVPPGTVSKPTTPPPPPPPAPSVKPSNTSIPEGGTPQKGGGK
jgi:hypothetical protein